MGRGCPETKLEAPSASQLGPLGWGSMVKPYSVLGMEGGGEGIWGLLENVFKTIKLWTFGCSDLSWVLGAATTGPQPLLGS